MIDESSFLSDSSKYRRRRPIFAKNQHSPVTKLADSASRTSSNLQLPNRNAVQNLSQSPSRVVLHSLKNSQALSRGNIPTTTRITFSQPKVTSPHIVYHQRPTPIIAPATTQQVIVSSQQPVFIRPVIHAPSQHTQHIAPTRPLSQTTQCFYKTQPVTFAEVRRISNHKENAESDCVVKQSGIAIERVMKEVGSNLLEKQIKYLPKEHDHEDYQKENDSSCCHRSTYDDEEVSKLAEINSLLSENYNLLYNEFYNLKKEIREEEVVEEQTFLKKSINQIESIFETQTSQAVAQMQQLSHPTRQSIKKVGRQMKNLYF